MWLDRANLAVAKVAKTSTVTQQVLSGLWVTPKGTWASDGYVLVRARAPTEGPAAPLDGAKPAQTFPVFVPRKVALEALDQAKKAKNSGPVALVCEPEEGKVQLRLPGQAALEWETLSELPPDMDRLFQGLKETKPVFRIGLSCELLEKLLAAVRAAYGTPRGNRIYLTFYGSERPIYFRMEDGKLDGLLMPVREDFAAYGVPEPWAG